MKTLLTLSFLVFFFSANAQQALLKFKGGNTQDVYILSVDSLYITTSAGRFALNDIEEAGFPERRGRDEHLYYEMTNAGVVVIFDKTLELAAVEPQLGDTPEHRLIQLRRSLDAYKRTQQIGLGLQLSGVLLGAVGMAFETDALIYLGAASAGTGLVLQLNAADKLVLY